MTKQTGVDFVYRDGQEAGLWSMLESAGGGIAVLDYDMDGRMDVFFPGGGEFAAGKKIHGRPSALFRNRGGWAFARGTDDARVGDAPHYTHGAAVGDFDNDGFADLLVTGYGELLLFRNNGDGTFTETAEAAGLHDRLWSISAAWGDINGDGNADLFVPHYVNWSMDNNPRCPGAGPEGRDICSPNDFDPLPDVLYMSNGDGTFRDASREAGLREDGKGMGVLIADFDLDGRLDVYVANDQTPNFLYRNQGPGLDEVGLRSGTALSDSGDSNGSMGVDLGDYNLDGRPDIGVSNFEQEDFALYRHENGPLFQHVSRVTGLTGVGGLYVGWGTHFADFDLDGDEDLFVCNGHVLRHPRKSTMRQPPLLMENCGEGRFANVVEAAGADLMTPRLGRGSAIADFDNDGDPDLAISCVNEPIRLFSNDSTGGNHWLALRLVGVRSSRDAVGAVVRIKTSRGEQMRQVKGGGSYASASDPRLIFGLRKDAAVEHIEIRWPSGKTQVLQDRRANQVHLIVEPRQD